MKYLIRSQFIHDNFVVVVLFMTMIGCGIELERERYTSVKVMNNNDAAAASFICDANMRNLLLLCSHETENQFNLR